MTAPLSEKNAQLLAILCAAAAEGAPCPSNKALCGRLDLHNYCLHKRMTGLARRGLIEIESDGSKRRIRDCAAGRWTGWSSRQEIPGLAAGDIPATLRKCLTCGVPFPSEGRHNRICSACKSTDAYRSADDAFYSCGGAIA